jgi:hypothetical protein
MRENCKKPVKVAKSGVVRGICTRPAGHMGLHSNKTCSICGVSLTPKSAGESQRKNGGTCRKCQRDWQRQEHGYKPRNLQIAKDFHTFPCGCSGLLPGRGESNNFAVFRSAYWYCRVSTILKGSFFAAKRRKYTSINPKTPHHIIRKLMSIKECWLCKRPLEWVFGKTSTPHLHHNHETGEIYGFAHARCNMNPLEDEIIRLRKRIEELELET